MLVCVCLCVVPISAVCVIVPDPMANPPSLRFTNWYYVCVYVFVCVYVYACVYMSVLGQRVFCAYRVPDPVADPLLPAPLCVLV